MADMEPLEGAEFALSATETVIWSVRLPSGETVALCGPADSLFNGPEGGYENMEVFFEQAVHPDDLAHVEQLYMDIQRGEATEFKVEFRTRPENGAIQWVRAHGQVHTEDGDRHLTGIATDITTQKRRERELRQKNERLEELASFLSHDFRNPLNVAQGRLELAKEDCESDHLEAVEQAHGRLEELVDSLLDGVRHDTPVMGVGQAAGSEEQVAVATLVEECWLAVETGEATHVSTVTETVEGNREQLARLFENLFRNAVEHGRGDVTIEVGDLEDEPGVYVADDGPGIPDGDRERVFEKGYSTSEAGVGFGLHIVEEIVAAHEWSISVMESAGGGARFEIVTKPSV